MLRQIHKNGDERCVRTLPDRFSHGGWISILHHLRLALSKKTAVALKPDAEGWDMEVSQNGCTPKSSILDWDVPLQTIQLLEIPYGNPHMLGDWQASLSGLQASWASYPRLTWYQCSPLHGWASLIRIWSSPTLKQTPPLPATNRVSHWTWLRLEDLGLPSCSILHHPFDLTISDTLWPSASVVEVWTSMITAIRNMSCPTSQRFFSKPNARISECDRPRHL